MKHLNFKKVELPDLSRRKRKGFPLEGYYKNNSEHGNLIFKSINQSIESVKQKSTQLRFNPYLVMKVELENGATFSKEEEEKFKSFGLKIIDKESKEIQVVFSENMNLDIFKSELESYRNGEMARTKIKNQDIFSKIKQISEWSREDRIGFNKEKIKNKAYVDVYLWVFDTILQSKSKMEEFKDFVDSNGGSMTDSYVGNSVVMARVRTQNNIIEKILENSLVYKIEDIEKINLDYNTVLETRQISIDDIQYDNSNLNPETSSSICIIDSGIFTQHPLFQGVIGDSKGFYNSFEENMEEYEIDYCGHGTKVASICAYGDFDYDQEFKPDIYIHNAKIHNGYYESSDEIWKKDIESNLGNFSWDDSENWLRYEDGEISAEEFINTFEDNKRSFLKMSYSRSIKANAKLIPNQMREIVDYFYTNYNCRIYNLSQGDSDSVYCGGKPKAWSCVLDELQNEYDILFVVSAGNYNYEVNSDYKNISDEYPKFLFQLNECKIIEPANSVNSITVGALALSGKVTNPNQGSLNIQAITDRNQLSSITRVGPGILNSIKPDFVAYGGDRAMFHTIMGTCEPKNNPGLDKLLFNNDNNGLFCWDTGTSFSAPYISHLAGKLLNEYPDISNNMIRSIIATSASIPIILDDAPNFSACRPEFQYNNQPSISKLMHYSAGYGFPDLNKCISSDNCRVILMCDVKSSLDAINTDQMHIYQIPLPPEFKSAKKKKKVTISLAYNPKVRNTRLDYVGTKLDYKLIKGKSCDQVIRIFKDQKGVDNIPTIEGVCNVFPASNVRGNGTLQKSEFIFTKDSGFNTEDLYLIVNCKMNWDNTPQKYGLTVVLETEDDSIQLYNLINNRLNQNIKDRVRL